jgi:hypothetical protein
MATTSGIISSYQEVGIKEDISEIITNISPTKTPGSFDSNYFRFRHMPGRG